MNNYNPSRCAYDVQKTAYQGTGGYKRAGQEKPDVSCDCTRSRFPINTALAMAYVPFQERAELYSCEKALSRGTLFSCLDKPFIKGCCK